MTSVATVKITVKVNRLSKMRPTLRDPEFVAMFKQWAVKYSAYLTRRFLENSEGLGDWAPLALSTVRARPKAAKRGGGRQGRAAINAVSLARDTQNRGKLVSAGRRVAILISTGTLLHALEIGANGNYMLQTPTGFKFGVAGGLTQQWKPGKTKGSKKKFPNPGVSVGELAIFHQKGGARRPKRKIIVKPDPFTLTQMRDDAKRAMQRYLRRAGS